ncbi:MAG: hypothetical protein A3J74_02925 [Elusimicrobia bacterium RIFCSPHIGHO2_02_FULL_57_9]|nr:MAG: hypothetical protein A3J74_02925 [Elusimicrobia bacterium RIFCSPHIGHO2_02_FULL_57_9]
MSDGLIQGWKLAACFQSVPPASQKTDRFNALFGRTRKPIRQFIEVLLRLRLLCRHAATYVFANPKVHVLFFELLSYRGVALIIQ